MGDFNDDMEGMAGSLEDFLDSKYWTTKYGQCSKISDLGDMHLLNIRKFCERQFGAVPHAVLNEIESRGIDKPINVELSPLDKLILNAVLPALETIVTEAILSGGKRKPKKKKKVSKAKRKTKRK
jgi:hypothetical protein